MRVPPFNMENLLSIKRGKKNVAEKSIDTAYAMSKRSNMHPSNDLVEYKFYRTKV